MRCDWRDDSAVKSKYCFSRGPEFSSRHPQWAATTICNPSSIDSTMFSGLRGHYTGMAYTDTHLKIKKINI